jgi:hypothetical protein
LHSTKQLFHLEILAVWESTQLNPCWKPRKILHLHSKGVEVAHSPKSKKGEDAGANGLSSVIFHSRGWAAVRRAFVVDDVIAGSIVAYEIVEFVR